MSVVSRWLPARHPGTGLVDAFRAVRGWSTASITAAALAVAVTLPAGAQLAPPDNSGMTYGHVHLNVSDRELHNELWVEHFGGEFFERGSLTGVKYPGVILLFTEREPTGGSQGTVLDHLGFKVREMQPILDRWREAGYEVQSEFTGAEGNPNAYLMAPDGVRIELQEDPSQPEDVIGHHVHWFTPGHEEIFAWYLEMFDLDPFERGTIATTTNVPGMNLSFNGAGSPREPTRGRAIDHIGFEFSDLEAAVRRLEERGVEFDVPLREVPSLGLKIAFFTDPSGVYVELTEGLLDY